MVSTRSFSESGLLVLMLPLSGLYPYASINGTHRPASFSNLMASSPALCSRNMWWQTLFMPAMFRRTTAWTTGSARGTSWRRDSMDFTLPLSSSPPTRDGPASQHTEVPPFDHARGLQIEQHQQLFACERHSATTHCSIGGLVGFDPRR